MKISLVLPALNWSAPQALPKLHTPYLNQFLRFGQITSAPCTPSDLFTRFLWQGSLCQHARHHYQLPSNTPAILASPLWQQMGMHHMTALSGEHLAITTAEASALCQGLSTFYAEEHWQFYPYRQDLWLITLPKTPDWQVAPVLDILGQIDGNQRATGKDAATWLSKQTEIQMWLHNHPCNQQRQQHNQPVINGLWLWQDLIGHASNTASTIIHSNSSWALPPSCPLPDDWTTWWQQLTPNHHHILFHTELLTTRHTADIWAYQAILEQWDTQLFCPLWQQLKQGNIHQLTLITDGEHGCQLHLTPRSLWAFWKRPRLFQGTL